MSGNRSGTWEACDKIKIKGRYYYKCKCICGCGEIKEIRVDTFNSGKSSKNCKAVIKLNKLQKETNEPKQMSRDKYKTRLIGKTFGNLYVYDFGGYNKNRQILNKCRCKCKDKTEVLATYTDLMSGAKDNCGCLTSKKMREAKRRYNTYDLSGDFGIGYTLKGEEFYFDLEDYDLVKDYCWHISSGGYVAARGIKEGDVNYVRMHRLIMDVSKPEIQVDHIYQILNDNRKSELRIVNNQQNSFNHQLFKNNTSGHSGVNYDIEKGLWRARMFVNYSAIHLGYYEEKEDAIKARQNAEIEHFGEYRYAQESEVI